MSNKLDRHGRFHYRKQWAQRFVDPMKGADHECLLLGMMGYYSRYIAAKTRLTEGQVNYRLAKYGISRAEIRGGESQFCRIMQTAARDKMDVALARYLRAK